MEELRSYSPEEIINKNLEEITRRLDGVCEQELSHLHELAEEIVSGYEQTPDGFVKDLPDHLPTPPGACNLDALPKSKEAVESLRSLHYAWQKIRLCIGMGELLSQKGVSTSAICFPYEKSVSAGAFNRIAYQASSYTNSAYLRFAPLLEVPRAAEAKSFVAACEEVYNGLCEFCILPLENTTEGLLYTFVRLIEKYDLKFAATCDVAGNDASRTSRFALLRRELSPPMHSSASELHFSCSVAADDAQTLSDLLLAANTCGLQLYRMDSMPQETGNKGAFIHLTLRVGSGNLDAFLLYLAMDMPSCQVLGLYPHLSI